MTKLEKLIEELCPNGVEYKTLGDICEIKTGKGITKKDSTEDGDYPIISGGKEPMGFYHSANRVANTVTISRVGANAGFVNFIDVDFYLNDKCFSVIPKAKYKELLDSKFIYEYLKNSEQKITDMQSEGGVPTINTQKVSSIAVPVPPIEVQREIVMILDKYSKSVEELQKTLEQEFTLRKKQYEYYRDMLLNFDVHGGGTTDCKWKTLGEMFPFIRNGFVGTVTPFYTNSENGVRYLQGTNIHNGIISDDAVFYINKEFHNKHIKNELKSDDILMVQSGHVGECAVVGEKYKGANCHALIIMSNGGRCNSNYVCYYLQSSVGKRLLKRITTGGTIKHILGSKIKTVKIPFPPLSEQERIVSILDRFDKLCNDISEGLPAEIEARQKQYEYYRDKLLAFKMKE